MRAGQDADEPADVRLVWAPVWPLRILHFPVRSLEQFRKRTEISIEHGGFREGGRFRRLRERYERGDIEQLYAELVWDDTAVAEGIDEGRLVRDERIARLLPRCPDPLAPGEAAPVRVEPDPQELERERVEVELDAMRLLTRTQRFTMLQVDRARRRIDELRDENERLKARLDRGSLAARLRRLFGRR